MPDPMIELVGLGLGLDLLGLGLRLDLYVAVWVSVLQSTFMQLLSVCGERGRELMLYLIWFRVRARIRARRSLRI